MPNLYYAHSLPEKPPSEWQSLEDHLKKVAELAQAFGEKFGAGDWAYLAGLWHDLGKCSKLFQDRLRAANGHHTDAEAKDCDYCSIADYLSRLKNGDKDAHTLRSSIRS
jgi:CRISPR-associated endonuclease Cas3-HD